MTSEYRTLRWNNRRLHPLFSTNARLSVPRVRWARNERWEYSIA